MSETPEKPPPVGPPTEPSPEEGALPTTGTAPQPVRRKRRRVNAGDGVAVAATEGEEDAGRTGVRTGGKWTAVEDKHLRRGVEEMGARNWKTISEKYLGGRRTDVQCLHRWQKVLRPGLVKGPWTKGEDDIIRSCIEAGINKWSEIAMRIPGRIGKQCRERWYNHLDPTIKKTSWTPEEDDKLREAVKAVGTRWTEVSKSLPGRSENACKNRWNSAARRKVNASRQLGDKAGGKAAAAAASSGAAAGGTKPKAAKPPKPTKPSKPPPVPRTTRASAAAPKSRPALLAVPPGGMLLGETGAAASPATRGAAVALMAYKPPMPPLSMGGKPATLAAAIDTRAAQLRADTANEPGSPFPASPVASLLALSSVPADGNLATQPPLQAFPFPPSATVPTEALPPPATLSGAPRASRLSTSARRPSSLSKGSILAADLAEPPPPTTSPPRPATAPPNPTEFTTFVAGGNTSALQRVASSPPS